MCLYVYMNECVYVYVCMCVYVCACSSTNSSVPSHLPVCKCLRVNMYARGYERERKRVCVYACMRVCVYTRMRAAPLPPLCHQTCLQCVYMYVSECV